MIIIILRYVQDVYNLQTDLKAPPTLYICTLWYIVLVSTVVLVVLTSDGFQVNLWLGHF